MPHDRFGKLLKVGDEVVYRGVITSISEGSETCNLNVKAVAPVKENHWGEQTFTAYLTELVQPKEEFNKIKEEIEESASKFENSVEGISSALESA